MPAAAIANAISEVFGWFTSASTMNHTETIANAHKVAGYPHIL